MEAQSFDQIWEHAAEFVGRRIRISGAFFSNRRSFVGRDFATCLEGRRIELADSGLIEQHLYGVLPAWGGGPFVFNELIVVTGTIQHREGHFELASLADCTITSVDLDLRIDVPIAS